MPPTLALFAGDPTGIGPEIVAKVIAAPESLPPAQIHLFAHKASLEAAAEAAGLTIDFDAIQLRERGQVVVHTWDGWESPAIEADAPRFERGEYTLAGLRKTLELAGRNLLNAVCFAPVDRASLRAAGMEHDDELHWAAQVLDYRGPCHEIHVLDNVWTVLIGRSASGEVIPLSAEDVADAIAVLADVQWRAGKLGGRIVVCAPDPQVGGHVDRELIDVLDAGVRQAIGRGFTAAEGPLPAEATMARAKAGGIDGFIITTPDQEPINATLMGYERGVTVFGGLPIAVTTTAHGTGSDIVGRGMANPWALRNAMSLALRIASGPSRADQALV